jgi:hypothetical protein
MSLLVLEQTRFLESCAPVVFTRWMPPEFSEM